MTGTRQVAGALSECRKNGFTDSERLTAAILGSNDSDSDSDAGLARRVKVHLPALEP